MAAPNLPILVYDGDCGFCTRSARWVARRGPTVVPWQALDLTEAGLSQDDVDRAAWWLAPGGVRLGGHRAIAAALVAIGGLWAIAGRVMAVPPVSWLAAGVYRLVARNRHRMPGSTDACAVDPTTRR